ncbi:MAG TPA: maltose alpha-D-glucosyltransferase [bacterium]|nr:maltose alpha-D-glucosyltransferase [bacterium]
MSRPHGPAQSGGAAAARSRAASLRSPTGDDPYWYKDAVIYEVHVRAFADSNGDGVGDFPGLTSRLDYIQSLGVTALWLLPFYPSPLKDDGYDIADYTGIHPSYGTMRDFRTFLAGAHARGLRVITELVLNHTSDRHPWFQHARRAAPGTTARDFYVWSDTPDRYRDARIIFRDFEPSNWTLDPAAHAYYWHRFYSHQPDLNFDSEAVRAAMLEVVDFWLGLGVDGMRLDAVPYLYEREGTICENLPETHAYLKALRRHIDERFSPGEDKPARVLLAEANQWPEDAIAYFGDGDECQMAFHFPLMPRLFMAIRQEDRFPIIEILSQTPPIPETCQWAMFLRNHDELTLEMVTDEDRDYMYRVYAHDPAARVNLGIRRRLAPLLGNHRRRIELMNGLLLSIPGTPVIYYGDEIGMGDNIYLGDRNSVRTPMQWSADRNAGFSRANPQRLFLPAIIDPEYHYETVNVEAQHDNPHSLLWWMRRVIAMRQRYRAFGRGTLEFLQPDNRKVLAFLRRYGDEQLLIVANLSRFVQYVELPLQAWHGMVPVEVFGHTPFPAIGELPYLLTLGPHTFYWFALEQPKARGAREPEPARGAAIAAPEGWEALVAAGDRALTDALWTSVRGRRWFGGKGRAVRGVALQHAVRLPLDAAGPGAGNHKITGGRSAYVAQLRVDYVEGEPEVYALLLAFAAAGAGADAVHRDLPGAVITGVREGGGEGVLYDGVYDRGVAAALFEVIAHRRRARTGHADLAGVQTQAFRRVVPSAGSVPESTVLRGEQSNTSILYGDRCILKLFRRPEAGRHPDFEIGRFLTERTAFPHTPQVAGAIEYRVDDEARTVAILSQFVPNEGDAWQYTLDELGHYYERVAAGGQVPAPPGGALIGLARAGLPADAAGWIGPYLDAARLLGQRTAELHLALASDPADPEFAPEPLTAMYQRSIYQSVRSTARRGLQMLRRNTAALDDAARAMAERVAAAEDDLLGRLRPLLEGRINAVRIRTHGDYHLGQVLWTGKDFVIIDFEGEPARPLSERRHKRPPLRDVAGMLRSFEYAALAALADQTARGLAQAPDVQTRLRAGARLWTQWVSTSFLAGYVAAAGDAAIVPSDPQAAQLLLDAFLIDKAAYELDYELNNRPAWAWIPLTGILTLLGRPPA